MPPQHASGRQAVVYGAKTGAVEQIPIAIGWIKVGPIKNAALQDAVLKYAVLKYAVLKYAVPKRIPLKECP